MHRNRRQLSAACWVVAGLPILASFVQAIVALLGTSASAIPVLGFLKQTLQTIPVLDAAATIFRSSASVVFVLFVLVTIAWIAQGVGLFALRQREFTLGATGFVTLFLALFVLVYLPLLSADVPTGQVAGFLLVPVIAAGASWGASVAFDWDETLDEETAQELSDARAIAQSTLDEFEERVSASFSQQERSSLQAFAPTAVEEFERGYESFRDECSSIIERAEQLSNAQNSRSSRQRNEQASQVLSDAEALSPEQQAERLLNNLKKSVKERIRDEFSSLHYVSRYQESYEIRNLREYNEVTLSALDGPSVQLGGEPHEVSERLITAIDQQGLGPTAHAIEQVQDHLDELEQTLDEREETVASLVDETEETLELASNHLETLEGEAQERLSEYLLEGRRPDEAPAVPNKPSVKTTISVAKEELHACRFDEAERKATEARSEAREIQAIAEFFAESVAATIQYGSGSVPIPNSVGSELVAQLRIPFEKSYDVRYTVKGDTLEIRQDDTHSPPSEESQPVDQATGNSTEAAPDDVLYVIRELSSTAAATSADDSVDLQTEHLPEKFVEAPILNEVKSFAERQSDVVGVTIPEDPPPGYLSIEVADDVSPQRVMDTLQNQYASTQ